VGNPSVKTAANPAPSTKPVPPPSTAPTVSPTVYDVIIIGAGISGISAAKTLIASGKKVILLEARNRTGGRMYTDTSNGWTAEMGAGWIQNYNPSWNPIIGLGTGYGLTQKIFNWDNGTAYSPTGTKYSSAQQTTSDACSLKCENNAAAYGNNQNNDISMYAAMQGVPSSCQNAFASDPLCNMWVFQNLEDEYGADVDNLSSWWYDTGSNNWSDTEAVFVAGYSSFVNATIASVNGGLNIVFNTIVTNINYASTPTVTTSSGTVYKGSKVIVTVPLGVLKSGSITFSPSLPSNKTSAIANQGFGLLNHIALKFPTGTLAAAGLDTTDVMYKVPNAFPSQSTTSTPRRGRGLTEIALWKRIRGLDVVSGEASGSFAQSLESLTDAQIVAALVAELTVIWTAKGLTLPTPTSYKISRWFSDPFAKGAYSYMRVGGGTDTTIYSSFQSGVSAGSGGYKLYFAGEHTDGNYPATVQGAYASGILAATKILRGTQ